MRIGTMVQAGATLVLVTAFASSTAQAQKAAPAKKAAPAQMAVAPAGKPERWEGTYTNDVTQKGGKLVIVATPSGENQMMADVIMTPMGAKAAIQPADPNEWRPAKAMGVPGTLTMSGDDLGGTIASYVDPSCNCTVVPELKGTVAGNTYSGNIAGRNSQTGQWNFTSFSVSKKAK